MNGFDPFVGLCGSSTPHGFLTGLSSGLTLCLNLSFQTCRREENIVLVTLTKMRVPHLLMFLLLVMLLLQYCH